MQSKKTTLHYFNRRQFLIMSGMSVGTLALNACGTPPATEATPYGEADSAPKSNPNEPQYGGTLRVAFADTNGNGVFEAQREELYGVRLQRVAGSKWLSGELQRVR